MQKLGEDRLMDVPNVQPPLPTDWEVHPTHPVHHIPYQLAQFWDRGVRERVENKAARLQAARKKQQLQSGSATGLAAGEVPRDLREASKRTPLVKTWVRALEEPVRSYLCDQLRREKEERAAAEAEAEAAREDVDSAAEQMDSDDEEIVFVGRNGAMRDLQEKRTGRWKRARREVSQETVDSGMVFDSFGNDESAAYKSVPGVTPACYFTLLTRLRRRWLTHSISDYYGLQSRSVTLGDPSRRVVYVGLKQACARASMLSSSRLPRPLWEVC